MCYFFYFIVVGYWHVFYCHNLICFFRICFTIFIYWVKLAKRLPHDRNMGCFCFYRDSTVPAEETEDGGVSALESEWDSLVTRLESLKQAVAGLKSKLGLTQGVTKQENKVHLKNVDITIFADPQYPPYAVLMLARMIQEKIGINISSHSHSTSNDVPNDLKEIFNDKISKSCSNNLCIIWKPVGVNLELIVSPISHGKLVGEVNAVRYLSRLLESTGLKWFERISEQHSSQVDHWLDKAHAQVILGPKKAQALVRSLDTQLSGQTYIVGDSVSPADVYMLSVFASLKLTLPKNVEKWYQNCKNKKWVVPFL